MFEAFRADQRAIEGLPIRLVIALVVGVASLSVMLNMISGIHGLTVTELDAHPSPEVVSPGHQHVELTVVDPDGDPVSGATVIVRGKTAKLDDIATAKTGTDGHATVDVKPHLRPNQDEGTLTVEIKPPSGGGYVDKRANTKILVVQK